MTEDKYRRLMKDLAPSRSEKEKMWARIEAAYSRKDVHVMENVIRENKVERKVLGWGPVIAAILLMGVLSTIFIGLYQNKKLNLPPQAPKDARVLLPASQESKANKENKENQSASTSCTNLPQISVNSMDFDQLWNPSYMGDPVRVDLPLPEDWSPPKTLPVYSLAFIQADVSELLKGSLQRWSKQMNIPLNWDELEYEEIPVHLSALSAVSMDKNWVVMASVSHFYGVVEIYVFPLGAYALNTTWPVGHVMNADPQSVGSELERAGLMVENQEELAKELNNNDEERIAAIERYIDSALTEANEAIEAWADYLPSKGEYSIGSQMIRGAYGSDHEIYSVTLREAFLTYGGDPGYFALSEKREDEFENALINSRFIRLKWLTVSDLYVGEDQKAYIAFDLPVPSALNEEFRSHYWDGQDPMSVSRSKILGYKLFDYVATAANVGEYPLRSLAEVEASIPELIAHPYSKDFDIKATGMSYRTQYPIDDNPGVMLPCYDFVLEGEGDGLSGLPKVLLEISIPAIKAEYIEVKEIPLGIEE